MIEGEDNDNHSSEEELEDIIGSARKKVYVSGSAPSARKTVPGRTSAVEKRKWSDVEQGNTRAGSGSSADEEVGNGFNITQEKLNKLVFNSDSVRHLTGDC